MSEILHNFCCQNWVMKFYWIELIKKMRQIKFKEYKVKYVKEKKMKNMLNIFFKILMIT